MLSADMLGSVVELAGFELIFHLKDSRGHGSCECAGRETSKIRVFFPFSFFLSFFLALGLSSFLNRKTRSSPSEQFAIEFRISANQTLPFIPHGLFLRQVHESQFRWFRLLLSRLLYFVNALCHTFLMQTIKLRRLRRRRHHRRRQYSILRDITITTVFNRNQKE